MEFLWLLLLFAIIVFWFAAIKRPMYEAVMIAFFSVAILSGHFGDIFSYLKNAMNSYLLFTLLCFMAFSTVVEKTGLINDFIDIIASLVGKFSGGAGYVAVVASSAFGSISGTGPGNAAAVGCIVIPAMKKTGFSSELAASVVMASSALGVVIPPSGTVVVCYAFLTELYPDACTFSQFWLIMWGVSFVFILQRIITLFVLIKREHIAPIPKENRPRFKQALKKGWKALFLPILVFLPFCLDALYNETFVAARIGSENAASFTNTLLVLVPSVAVSYVLLVHASNGTRVSVRSVHDMFLDTVSSIAPTVFLVVIGFAIGNMFNDIQFGAAVTHLTSSMDLSLWAVVIIVPLVLCIMGMFLEVMTITMLITTPLILIGVSVGINPILMAAMCSVMVAAMGHMTPPFALTFYVAMGIAESDFAKTTKMAVIWCVGQYVLTVLVLLSIVPIPGMVPFTP